ncbi:MAG: hypothetical protein HUU35_00090 [Armatimonadetes bacterium]|nr:hypothetical protein [Armatimonadota bacterium]
MRVWYGQEQREVHLFVPLTERRPRNLTESGTILMNGKPFFPIGVYHVRPTDFAALAAAGFNSVQGIGPTNLEAFAQHLDLARQHGLTVDVPLYTNGGVAKNLADSLAAIAAQAGHPALMDWKIIDEPDLRPDVVDEVAGVYRALKAAGAPQPIELTLATPNSYPFWAPFCDIMQIDPYPLPSQPIALVAAYTKAAKAVLEPWQNLTVVLQSGWTPNLATQPSYEQARTMVYLALIHGAKGLSWYSLRDPGWNLMETPLWPHFKQINAESARLGEVVIHGAPLAGVSVTPADLHVGAWTQDGQWKVMLANPTNEARQAVVTLPGGAKAARVVCGSGQATVTGQQLTVPMAATSGLLLEVQR